MHKHRHRCSGGLAALPRAFEFPFSIDVGRSGWNYEYLGRLTSNRYPTVLNITGVLWESFFGGDDVPLTLGVIDLSMVAAFVAAVEELGTLLVRELSTRGVLQAFLQAADAAYRMGSKDFADLGHFLDLLVTKLPKSEYAATDYVALVAKIDAIQAARAKLFVHFNHSNDVPYATGLNLFLPTTDTAWRKHSKLFFQLYGYTDWHYVVGYVYGIRSGDITDSFLASDLLRWTDSVASIRKTAQNISISRALAATSLENAVGAVMQYGIQVDTVQWLVGQTAAGLDTVTGVVNASWNWKLLTLGVPKDSSTTHTQCAVFHEQAGKTLLFDVMFYRVGKVPSQAYGVYSIESGQWSLYNNATSGAVSQIMRDDAVSWLVPMVIDADGRLVETTIQDCKKTLFFTTYCLLRPTTSQGTVL